MTETGTFVTSRQDIEDQHWYEGFMPSPDDGLPFEDGEPMEGPWQREAATCLKAGYIAARGGSMDTFFVGCNMFLYYRMDQLEETGFKGPDLFIVKDVDGKKPRLSWKVWEEQGTFPNVIVEILSVSTEKQDLTEKKALYEQIFRTKEYICFAPEVRRLIGWRHNGMRYVPIPLNSSGWLFSEELGLWLGRWYGTFLGQEATWPRWYTREGKLVLLPNEAEHQQAEEARQQLVVERQQAEETRQQLVVERQRSERLAERLRALGIELEDENGSV